MSRWHDITRLAAATLTLGFAGCDTVVPGHTPDPTPSPDAAQPVEDDDPEPGCGNASFGVTETQENFTVPDNVYYMHVKAWGAGGNHEGLCAVDDGGVGGYSEAVFSVNPGDELAVIVGKRGRAGTTGEDQLRFGFGGWGGGGLSGIFTGFETITEGDNSRALIVAGGGGSSGRRTGVCDPGGPGNHPDAGGAPSMLGTAGGDDVNGGGGGYTGGLGGAGKDHSSGGAGFVASSAIDSQMAYAAAGTADPPNSTDTDYDGTAGKNEASGLVVIHFSCEPPEIDPIDDPGDPVD